MLCHLCMLEVLSWGQSGIGHFQDPEPVVWGTGSQPLPLQTWPRPLPTASLAGASARLDGGNTAERGRSQKGDLCA